MSGVEILLAVAGTVVTLLTVAGMILITPRGEVAVHAEDADPHGSPLSPRPAPDRPAARATA